MNNAPQPEKLQPKPRIIQCVCASGQIIIRQVADGTDIPQTLTLPMNLSGDSRLFLKNGKLVSPFITVDFKHRKTLDVSGIDIHIFNQTAMHEFDPTDMEPVAVRSLEEDFNELNPGMAQ